MVKSLSHGTDDHSFQAVLCVRFSLFNHNHEVTQ